MISTTTVTVIVSTHQFIVYKILGLASRRDASVNNIFVSDLKSFTALKTPLKVTVAYSNILWHHHHVRNGKICLCNGYWITRQLKPYALYDKHNQQIWRTNN